MTYNETGFRPFYHHFCVFPLNGVTKPLLAGFPGEEQANSVLVYGYYDEERGMMLEVIAATVLTEKGPATAPTTTELQACFSVEEVADDEFMYFSDENKDLFERYGEKLKTLEKYNAAPEIEETREMYFLDNCREKEKIDIVKVYLLKQELETEECKVQIIGTGDHYFKGILLEEPKQDFGYHKGEKIAFSIQEENDGTIACYSDMNPRMNYTSADLADGKRLEEAIKVFNAERSEKNVIAVLELLRDSMVWVPYTVKMSAQDQDRLNTLIFDENGNMRDTDTLSDFVMKDETRMNPDILKNGEQFFFPAFSTKEAMGEYGNHFARVQKPFLEVISMAKENEKKPVGIVINAFTEPFIFDMHIWHIVEKMPSKIQ